ncbi:Rop guanine nucleotide exchange factor [Thalictrum thalictroides]|uniref:Rop guanine nucleotide exchange factor n=1 Tax=Thalictrum thalictroides TaxID=46969 RepID=A0A7J6VRY3_THATH|nr:Rop guanine nucleotide exchange factor [Thalictrum thalictroides]
MVRASEKEEYIQKLKSFSAKKIFDISTLIGDEEVENDPMLTRSQGSFDCKSRLSMEGAEEGGSTALQTKDRSTSDVDMMKERFAKLLLGEDMSGGGKGVSSALSLSNAITNLAASVFGEQRRLEPMSPDRKVRWKKEIDWLLSVTDHIVEMVPSQQKTKEGISMEIMTTRQRFDILTNIPALRKLDAMLIGYLDNFKSQNEFWYVSKDATDAEKGRRKDDKWWLPTVKVPPNGLSEESKKWMQFQKESVNQVLKAAMAINAQVLSEMVIPDNYIETLPKNGRESLGDLIYRSITIEFFDPEQFLSTMDMSTEHKVLDLKNRIEASIVIWRRKMIQKDGKSSWGSAVSLEKRELFEERAESILLLLKQRFPGLPQSSLDICKIQYCKDIGQAVLESYSRVLESLSHTVMSRIEDVLYADSLTQDPALAGSNPIPSSFSAPEVPVKFLGHSEEQMGRMSSVETPTSMTLLDFLKEDDDEIPMPKPDNAAINKRHSYIEKLETLGGLRSPRARH